MVTLTDVDSEPLGCMSSAVDTSTMAVLERISTSSDKIDHRLTTAYAVYLSLIHHQNAVHTGACDPNIRDIQLEFEGASSYFPGEYNFSDPSFFKEQFEKLQKAIESNILHLKRNSLTTFAGSKQNLNYTSGGEFDIGITVTYQDGKVAGYGIGQTNFALEKAMRISPPEALVQLRNSNLTLGLNYTVISLALIATGLSGFINLILRYAHPD